MNIPEPWERSQDLEQLRTGMKMAHVERGGLDLTEPSVKMMMSGGGIFSTRELKMIEVSCGLIEAAELREPFIFKERGRPRGRGNGRRVGDVRGEAKQVVIL